MQGNLFCRDAGNHQVAAAAGNRQVITCRLHARTGDLARIDGVPDSAFRPAGIRSDAAHGRESGKQRDFRIGARDALFLVDTAAIVDTEIARFAGVVGYVSMRVDESGQAGVPGQVDDRQRPWHPAVTRLHRGNPAVLDHDELVIASFVMDTVDEGTAAQRQRTAVREEGRTHPVSRMSMRRHCQKDT